MSCQVVHCLGYCLGCGHPTQHPPRRPPEGDLATALLSADSPPKMHTSRRAQNARDPPHSNDAVPRRRSATWLLRGGGRGLFLYAHSVRPHVCLLLKALPGKPATGVRTLPPTGARPQSGTPPLAIGKRSPLSFKEFANYRIDPGPRSGSSLIKPENASERGSAPGQGGWPGRGSWAYCRAQPCGFPVRRYWRTSATSSSVSDSG